MTDHADHRESLDHALLQSLHALHRKVDQLMSAESDLQTDLDAIRAAVVLVLAQQTAQASTIADLKAQLAAGTPVSQAQLDALDTEAKAIVAALTPIAPPA
jgi:hypothetical protein